MRDLLRRECGKRGDDPGIAQSTPLTFNMALHWRYFAAHDAKGKKRFGRWAEEVERRRSDGGNGAGTQRRRRAAGRNKIEQCCFTTLRTAISCDRFIRFFIRRHNGYWN